MVAEPQAESALSDPYLTVQQMASEIGVSWLTMHDSIRKDPLLSQHILRAGKGRGKGIRIRRSVFEAWARSQEGPYSSH